MEYNKQNRNNNEYQPALIYNYVPNIIKLTDVNDSNIVELYVDISKLTRCYTNINNEYILSVDGKKYYITQTDYLRVIDILERFIND